MVVAIFADEDGGTFGKVNRQLPCLEVLESGGPEFLAVLVGCDCVDEPGAAVFDEIVDAFGPDETAAEEVAGESFASVESIENALVKFRCHDCFPFPFFYSVRGWREIYGLDGS